MVMRSTASIKGEDIIKRHSYSTFKYAKPTETGIKKLRDTRPPVQVPIIDGPSFFTYNIPKDPPMMTSSPAFTFRPKTQADREGGQQRAWGKEWFAHNHVWLQKADFDPRMNWPAPTEYNIQDSIGTDSPIHPRSSSYSFSGRKDLKWGKEGAADQPGPFSYRHEEAKNRLLLRPKTFTIQKGGRDGNYLWGEEGATPGPGFYDPKHRSHKLSRGFTFAQSPRALDYSPRYTL